MHRPAAAYALALLVAGAAVLLRQLLDPLLGDSLPLVTLFGAVAVAVWVGGYGPAVLAATAGYLAANYLFIEPRGVLVPDSVENVTGVVAYLVTCALIVGIGEAMRRAQARAHTRGELMRITLSSIGDAVIVTDNEGRVTSLNAVAQELTAWPEPAAIGRPLDEVFRIVNEDTRQPVPNPALRALREGTAVGLANHTVLIARDGVERSIDDSAAPIRAEDGTVSGSVLVFRDISERRRWERQEADRLVSARQLASIVETSDDAIVRKSLDGIIQSWNAGAERIFGYTAEEAVGRHISLIIPPQRLAEEDRIIDSLKAGRRVDHFETERRHRTGRRIWVSLTISPILDDDGRVVAASKIARDVTRQREADAERQRFVTLVESSTDFIGICDLQGVPIYINRAGLEMVGLDSIEAASRVNVRDFFLPEDQPRIMEELFPAVLQHGHGALDVRFRNFRTGATRWMAYKVLTLLDASGAPVAIATVSQDITARNEFLATLAHELRNPLAPLGNMLEVLKRADGDLRTRALAVSTMERQLRQMVRLVDDLLDLNRITHNRLELRKEVLSLNAVVEQAVDAVRPLADAEGHTLRVFLSPVPIELSADAVRLVQVFGNLLNNACKYSERGGTITVVVERLNDEAIVTVSDTGAGIPADRLSGIFEMFAQVETSRERSQGGLGIGLTLVRRLAEMHGGSVEAYSEGVGKGSRFVVRLPIVLEPRAAMPAPPPMTLAGRRILVVDDNRDAASSLSMLLELDGHAVVTAHDGQSALAAAESHRPDVALLDIGLPLLDGYEVCRRIRHEPWGRAMLLVALTGWGHDEDRARTRDAGFDAHLVKPVNYAELMSLLGAMSAGPPAAGA